MHVVERMDGEDVVAAAQIERQRHRPAAIVVDAVGAFLGKIDQRDQRRCRQ